MEKKFKVCPKCGSYVYPTESGEYICHHCDKVFTPDEVRERVDDVMKMTYTEKSYINEKNAIEEYWKNYNEKYKDASSVVSTQEQLDFDKGDKLEREFERKYIIAKGNFGYDYYSKNTIAINLSSIWTKLIKEAGRWCDFFASDLLIDYEIIMKYLKEDFIYEKIGKNFYFGFYRSGVYSEGNLARHGIDMCDSVFLLRISDADKNGDFEVALIQIK